MLPQADAYLEARFHRHRTVEDVMTTAVVTVDRLTPCKETLAGQVRPGPGQRHDLIRAAIRLIWDVDGVVDVVNRTIKGESPHEPGK